MIGKVFSRLTVLKIDGRDKSGKIVWECLCECGKTTFVVTSALTTKHTRSCGCLKIEVVRRKGRYHDGIIDGRDAL